MTIQQFKQNAMHSLEKSSSPQLDVEVLLQFSLNLSKTQILLNRNDEISEEKLNWLNSAIEKRKTGFPIAYITGHKEFYGYDFLVSPAVLIPKPDTEILVEKAIDSVIEKMETHENSILNICDMCTGSGCIGISVLKSLIENYQIPFEKLPKFTLVDISDSALEIASKNLEKLIPEFAKSRIRFVRSNLFEMVPWKFDLIFTNPPYVPSFLVDEMLQDGRNEPRLALDGDVTENGEKSLFKDGLSLIRRLIPQAEEHLSSLGTMIMETGEYNAILAKEIAESYNFKTELYQDLEGQLRGFICYKKNLS